MFYAFNQKTLCTPFTFLLPLLKLQIIYCIWTFVFNKIIWIFSHINILAASFMLHNMNVTILFIITRSLKYFFIINSYAIKKILDISPFEH